MLKSHNLNDPHLQKVERPKVSGLNHLWDGPLDTTGYPMGKGYSAGKDGVKLKMDCPCDSYSPEPITQRAKRK